MTTVLSFVQMCKHCAAVHLMLTFLIVPVIVVFSPQTLTLSCTVRATVFLALVSSTHSALVHQMNADCEQRFIPHEELSSDFVQFPCYSTALHKTE